MAVGATTPSAATFAVVVDGGGPVRIAVSESPDMSAAVFTVPSAVDAQGAARVSVAGLDPDTSYWWQVEDNGVLDTSETGRFRTHPGIGTAASFAVACIGDAGLTPVVPGVAGLAPDRLSNHPAFDLVRTHPASPLMVAHLGDLHYYDLGSDQHGIVGGGSLDNYRTAYADVLAQPRQHQLYREIPWVYLWDDHDFGPDNSDGTLAAKGNAAQAYRERTPHYTLAEESGPIYHKFQVGRILFVASDTRYERSPSADPDGPSKTMLGASQKAWLADLLASSTARALVWLMPTPWLGAIDDTWGGYATERAELVEMLGDLGWLQRMVMVSADVHALALASSGQPHGGFPILQCASIDATPSVASGSQYDRGFRGGRNQYGLVQVTDAGSQITIRLSGWVGTSEWGHYSLGISLPRPVATGALTRTLSGSHRATFEARLVTTFQTGEDPAGTELPILSGDVQMDAAGKIQRTLHLDTAGIDELTGEPVFPRRPTDRLSPYGDEVFVRRGVDIGPSILWSPLGYYRLHAAEQDDAPDGPIRLIGQDRMAGIIDARPLAPREFAATRTVASVFAEIVGEVYPEAVVVFDDDTGSAELGRPLVMEDSRHDVLAEIVAGHGKIFYWDGAGFLQVRTPPDVSQPVWEVNAGRSGVLIRAGRRISREGVYNAVVATGEGGSTAVAPVRGVAVDNGPNSPTRWGGRFGRVVRFYSSPVIVSADQARLAAQAILRRSLGTPYSVDFGSVVNPALVPHDPVRITLRDGSREVHVLQRLTVPLTAEVPMAAATRDLTHVLIGEPL
jgi:hypothetical protein